MENNYSPEMTDFKEETEIECFIVDIKCFVRNEDEIEQNKEYLIKKLKEDDAIDSFRKFLSVFDGNLD